MDFFPKSKKLAAKLLNDCIKSGVGHAHNLQYINESHIAWLLSNSYNILNTLSDDNSYLDLGHGGGFLKYINSRYFGLDIEHSEWEIADSFYKKIQNLLQSYPDYESTSILSKNFEIKNCNKKYDYMIFMRFYGAFNVANITDEENVFAKNVRKYCKKGVIVWPESTKNGETIIKYDEAKLKKVERSPINLTIIDF